MIFELGHLQTHIRSVASLGKLPLLQASFSSSGKWCVCACVRVCVFARVGVRVVGIDGIYGSGSYKH